MFEKWIELGLKKGLSDLEIYATSNQSLKLSVYQGKIDQHVKSKVSSVRIKGIYKGKVASVSTENISDEAADKLLDLLIESAKNITVNEPAIIFEGSKSYPKVNDSLFDFNTVDFSQKVDMLKTLEALISKHELVNQVQNTMYQEVRSQTTLVNSKGLNLSRQYTYAYAYAIGVFQKGEDIKTAYEIKAVKDFSEFNPQEQAQKTIDKGIALVGGESIKTKQLPTVFSKEMFADILSAFTGIFSAESAYRGLTALKDKVGELIASDKFNLIDDPLHEKAFFQNSFDDEGVACGQKYIIENGVFKGFMHNLKTAAIFKQEPTGHGFGGGIGPSNLYLEPGKRGFDEVISDIKEGIYITDLVGLHAGVQTVSGDFSLQAAGFKIEGGKITSPAKMIVVSGNFFDMIKNIKEIANDLTFDISGFGSPTVYAGNLVIAGEQS